MLGAFRSPEIRGLSPYINRGEWDRLAMRGSNLGDRGIGAPADLRRSSVGRSAYQC
jgi:hypothetical protein